ncbi:MAG: sigma-70 family RNA polymerase sigma factor [Phycisphaerales bacterium]|nr:sigma-70 family RNA polymerase sigma factor [Phycisphaerales bacterium]
MSAKNGSILGDYLREIKKYALLTAEQERELGLRIRARADAERRLAEGEIDVQEYDRIQHAAAEARDQMAQANLRLVISVAKNFRNRGLPLEDLVNEGNVGLMNAIDRFDPDMGSRFSTYAGYWIDQAIRRAVQMSQQMIHIPSYLMEQIGRMKLAMKDLEAALGQSPSINEVARHMSITPRKAKVIMQAIKACTTRRQASTSADGDNVLNEALEDTKTPPPHEQVFSQSDAELVSKLLGRITEREAIILKLRYGLSERKGKRMTLKEIGTHVGLTRERVRQIEREAKEKLEEYIKQNM